MSDKRHPGAYDGLRRYQTYGFDVEHTKAMIKYVTNNKAITEEELTNSMLEILAIAGNHDMINTLKKVFSSRVYSGS